jgi:enoyl-CoA hydratase/carnithine racemase
MAVASSSPDLRLERDGAVAWLLIDRAQTRNTLTVELADALARTVAELAADPTMRVLVIRGAGDKAFSAGFDIGAIGQTTEISADGSVSADRRLDEAFRAIEDAPFPVIAAIRGHCIGGGFELALACDLRIVADDAQFRMPPAQLGWVYGLSNLARFVSVLGPSRARQVFLASDTFDAATALAWGVAHAVIPALEFDGYVERGAARIAGFAPIALAGLKQGIAALARAQVLPQDLEQHREWRRRAFASHDLLEGRAAFLDRRAPNFTGE